MKYIVDITKPPIPPPNRTMRDAWFFGLYETKESKEKTKAWEEYIKEYRKTFKNKGE